jgi:hypothetical protein
MGVSVFQTVNLLTRVAAEALQTPALSHAMAS